ncbi:hypothetical protein F5050DRAFT_1895307 [Lentinula boryana]|uniref:Non-specific serine/threonine protein kinase n=1 Tax=Lentinula boryana TaxID=40481 RepID=A0ABQ8QBY6_9AGAR|nr:hypothetical protein F5050DRAFT_1895307 [Lentinula boryana]
MSNRPHPGEDARIGSKAKQPQHEVTDFEIVLQKAPLAINRDSEIESQRNSFDRSSPSATSSSSSSGSEDGSPGASNSTTRESSSEPTKEGLGSSSNIGVPADSVPSAPESIVVDRAGIILHELIARSQSDYIIWRGILILEGLDFTADHLPIVVKLADWERDRVSQSGISAAGRVLLAEAKIYEYLANVAPQSEITPHYYGTFNDSGSIALIIDNGGDRLPSNSLAKLDDNEKHKLFEKAKQLHRLGIYHYDLSERNIIMDEDRNLRIIDFHHAKLNHYCSWTGFGGCDELKQFADDLKLKLY